jgi:SH3-like domain-containing protein
MAGLKIVLAGVLAGLGLAVAGCQEQVAEGKDCPEADRARTVSGFCVPRYVSLKRGEVYGRKGPGKDYPALWIYHVKGLPVQVVAETTDWRRICDPQGGAVWVHRSMVDGRRTVMAMGEKPLALRKAPAVDAPVTGYLNALALASLHHCQGDWCKVSADGVSGWLESSQTWGVAKAPQCR